MNKEYPDTVREFEHSLLTKPTTQADIVGGYWSNDDDEEYF